MSLFKNYRVRAVLCLLALVLGTVAQGQEFPVEIPLVSPDGLLLPDHSASAATPHRDRPDWNPPTRECRVCKAPSSAEGCDCDTLLTLELAQELLGEVESALHRASGGRLLLHHPVQVRTVTRQRLARMGGERLLGLYEDGTIWLSYDLNRRQAYAVLAHEYGHAWLFERRTDIETPNELLFEGFAEFVSYLAVKEAGDHRTVHRIAHLDNSVYGRGARALLAVYRRAGLSEVLNLALTGREL